MFERAPHWLPVVLLCAALPACRDREGAPVVPDAPAGPTPDRLTESEKLPESETAFGLPIPRGMRLTRHFRDAAYFSGSLTVDEALDHVRGHVDAHSVEMAAGSAIFARARIRGDEKKRRFRIEIRPARHGSQVYVRDVTPPPPIQGLSEAERWQMAGRNPDGTLINPNQVY